LSSQLTSTFDICYNCEIVLLQSSAHPETLCANLAFSIFCQNEEWRENEKIGVNSNPMSFILIACANTNQIPKSLSSSYDGIWDGSAQTPGGDQYIKLEIKNGIVSGFVEHSVNGSVSGFYEEPKING
jgi:hypothetical protein